MPGQFGPMMRVALPLSLAYAQNAAVSCTGMPSVITITSGDRRVDRLDHRGLGALLGGTKTTETSAPVCAIASPTVPNTGTLGAAEIDRLAGLARVGAADDLGAGRDHPRCRACVPRSR